MSDVTLLVAAIFGIPAGIALVIALVQYYQLYSGAKWKYKQMNKGYITVCKKR